jgi:hypothetical protein
VDTIFDKIKVLAKKDKVYMDYIAIYKDIIIEYSKLYKSGKCDEYSTLLIESDCDPILVFNRFIELKKENELNSLKALISNNSKLLEDISKKIEDIKTNTKLDLIPDIELKSNNSKSKDIKLRAEQFVKDVDESNINKVKINCDYKIEDDNIVILRDNSIIAKYPNVISKLSNRLDGLDSSVLYEEYYYYVGGIPGADNINIDDKEYNIILQLFCDSL